MLDFVGPLGRPSEVPRACKAWLRHWRRRGLRHRLSRRRKSSASEGMEVDVIAGFRYKDMVILEEEFRAVSDHLYHYDGRRHLRREGTGDQ